MTVAHKVLAYAALTLGAVATLTGCNSAQRVAKTEKAYPPVGQFVDVTGGKVHYIRKGSGPELILLHGAGGNLRDWTFDGLLERLTDTYTVTAFDRPGLGYTDRVPGIPTGAFATIGDSPQAQARMLREAAGKLGITDPIVAGHSFGGTVAIAWAVAGLDEDAPHNARAITSFAGVAMPWPGDLGRYYTINGSALGGAFVIPLISSVASDSQIEMAIDGVFAPQPAPAGYTQHVGARLTLRPDSFRANVRQVNKLYPYVVALTARYPELTLPIEILHGTADATVPIDIHAREIVKIVLSVRVRELEGVGHMPHHVAPLETVDAIARAAARAGLH
ncbi:MAG: alpha/beta hydrolase [Yoonia sp.]|nr:alpha/beta hydrolase [Yoonia sp.]